MMTLLAPMIVFALIIIIIVVATSSGEEEEILVTGEAMAHGTTLQLTSVELMFPNSIPLALMALTSTILIEIHSSTKRNVNFSQYLHNNKNDFYFSF